MFCCHFRALVDTTKWDSNTKLSFQKCSPFITIFKHSTSVVMAANCALHSLVEITLNYTFKRQQLSEPSHNVFSRSWLIFFYCSYTVAVQKWIININLLNGAPISFPLCHFFSMLLSGVAGSRWRVVERLRDGRAGELGGVGKMHHGGHSLVEAHAHAPLQSRPVIESPVSHTVRHHHRLWVPVTRRLHIPLLNHCTGVHRVVTGR